LDEISFTEASATARGFCLSSTQACTNTWVYGGLRIADGQAVALCAVASEDDSGGL
jgi:hypothetical protein